VRALGRHGMEGARSGLAQQNLEGERKEHHKVKRKGK
jgi:hypothetical protein